MVPDFPNLVAGAPLGPSDPHFSFPQKMGMTEDDKRNCCLLEIQETEAKYYKTLEDIEKVRAEPCFPQIPQELCWAAPCRAGRGRKMGEEEDPHECAACRNQNQHFYFIIFFLWLLQIRLKTLQLCPPHPGVRISHSWLSQAGFADKSPVCRDLLSLWLPRNNSFIPSAGAVLTCHWS